MALAIALAMKKQRFFGLLLLALSCLGFLSQGHVPSRGIACIDGVPVPEAISPALSISMDVVESVEDAARRSRLTQSYYEYFQRAATDSLATQQAFRQYYGLQGPLFSAYAPIDLSLGASVPTFVSYGFSLPTQSMAPPPASWGEVLGLTNSFAAQPMANAGGFVPSTGTPLATAAAPAVSISAR
jgi:hypothetical protein